MAQKTNENKMSRRFRNLVFFLFCLLVLGAFSRLVVIQAERYNALRTEYNRIDSSLTRAQAREAYLNYQIAHFDSDAYIEMRARERFGWVRPNELVFRRRVD